MAVSSRVREPVEWPVIDQTSREKTNENNNAANVADVANWVEDLRCKMVTGRMKDFCWDGNATEVNEVVSKYNVISVFGSSTQ